LGSPCPAALTGIRLDSDVIVDVLRGRMTMVEVLRAYLSRYSPSQGVEIADALAAARCAHRRP